PVSELYAVPTFDVAWGRASSRGGAAVRRGWVAIAPKSTSSFGAPLDHPDLPGEPQLEACEPVGVALSLELATTIGDGSAHRSPLTGLGLGLAVNIAMLRL